MVKTTKAQRKALKRVFDRQPVFAHDVGAGLVPLTYRQFRSGIHGGYGCVMVFWCGMWLGIERDGYTHS